jgi:hypothetical protein
MVEGWGCFSYLDRENDAENGAAAGEGIKE